MCIPQKSLILILIRLLIPNGVITGQENGAALPFIERLDTRDTVFKQFLDDVEQGRRAARSAHNSGETENIARGLTLYSYTPNKEDDILKLAARCNIPYDTISTLNRIPYIMPDFQNTTLILPSVPGIFMPETPKNDLERLIISSRGGETGVPIIINMPDGKQRFRFIPGGNFTPNERTFFLNPGLFHFPLRKFTLTSAFGQRISPISGRNSSHSGLDLAAPTGTEVYAVRGGVVIESAENSVYGKYVVIQHDNGWTSLYGHLSRIDAVLRGPVKPDTIIGRVGSTGLSTGPHLHFELRQSGKAQDPAKLLGRAGNK
ncbi:MAG: M23 family metallopeptidase [Spirochaetaceae bacterium]|jgi:murein DD-endopeptidase MepM/ murein hydrolase activator NlpD|nr:M23 family metallopeptidase [Spirochaetaceae bacterium]